MSPKMKVKKGDLVHMIKGKDRGKQGRVLDSRPAERRVIVENLNTVKRHTKPKPMRDSSRKGGTQMTPGGVIEKASPVPVANVMVVRPTCHRPTGIGVKEKPVKHNLRQVRAGTRPASTEAIDQ